ncbi:hypothetical protein [uncultured Jatrophihabitans sp.]|uniref:hypothetical protein n=1 Tax=uncultured Jatrophihabitans sp. TaxID=1610747 RepID=UPI0035CBD6C8
MTVHHRSTTLVATSALVAALVGGCSSSATKDSATKDHAGSHSSTTSSTTSKTSTGTSSASGAKCTDLTAAAASAAVGKAAKITLLSSGAAGETNCSIKAGADPDDPDAYYGLDVRPNEGQTTFNEEKQAISGTSVAGIGDQAFTSTTGLAVLSHGVVIEVSGPRSSDYTIPTAIAKAMIATLR